MRSRKRLLLTTTFLVAALSAGVAEAQPKGSATRDAGKSSSQFTLRREEAGGPDAATARSRARAGDCAGALPAFDNAVRLTIEPSLRRDRGLCHEKLGSPFPAIEDYRYYLTSRPDAPDADQIRDRLSRLEEQVGIGGPSSQQVKDDSFGAGGTASFSLGTDGTSGGSSSTKRQSNAIGPRAGEQGRSYDYYAAQERVAESADSSPLRFGTGGSIGPFLQVPRYFISEGNTSDPGFAIGGTIRYAWTSALTFVSEIGYVSFGTSGQDSKIAGPLLFAGVEWRIPLNTYASDQLYLGVGPGFERYGNANTKIALNVLAARGRFGYRHVFGPAVGLELGVDGGPGVAFLSGLPDGVDATSQSLILISGGVALVIGF